MSKYIKWIIRLVVNTMITMLGLLGVPVEWAYSKDSISKIKDSTIKTIKGLPWRIELDG